MYRRRGDRDVLCVLAGRIAAGLLCKSSSSADQPINAVMPETMKMSRKAQVFVTADLREKQVAARAMRTMASSRQAHVDLASKKRSFKTRLTKKVSLKPGMLKARGIQQKPKKTKSSSASIHRTIESNLAVCDDID